MKADLQFPLPNIKVLRTCYSNEFYCEANVLTGEFSLFRNVEM
jgi:hypothetical protein